MSEHATPPTVTSEPVDIEAGLEAFQSGPEFRGPVEELDGHRCNDHFAQIYEADAERFATAIPFVRQGLERGERVMYVVDESSEAEVRAVLRDGEVDVDAALDAGQLSFHTVQDTYLRDGSFDPDEIIEFYADAVATATEEYDALRIVAETTWLQDDATTVEQFVEYEAKVNDLFADEDCLALCQYDRTGFPPEIVRNIVQTHPHLIYDGAVCHNFYYTPPEEYFGPDEPARENDRMLRTLRDRAAVKTKLQRRERFLETLYEITSATDRGFDEKLQAVFELGCEWFDLELGGMARVDPDDDLFEVETISADHDYLVPGARVDLSETYCRVPAAAGEAVAEPVEITDPVESGFEDAACYTEFGVRAYLGTRIAVDGGLDRTFFFVSDESRDDPITDEERTFHRLMAQWVGYELERNQRECFLRRGYEITSDPARAFDEKLQALFDLGCEQFDLELGAMAKVDPDEDRFEVEHVSDDHEHFGPGLELPLSETYCTAATDAAGVGSVEDPVEAGYDDIYVHNEFGIKTYLGTYIEVEGDLSRTFFFVSEEPRREPFSDDERTFQRLLGQWVKYELERRQRERFLGKSYKITSDPDLKFEEKIERLLALGCEQFELEMAGLNHLPTWDGPFRLEKGVGLGVDDEEELWTDPNVGCFCRRTIEQDEPVGMRDVDGTDWAEDTIHREFGLTSYLGTKVSIGSTPYGTLWFGGTEARDRSFSDTERTFIELMGQWVSYELERRDRERELRERTEHLSALVETTPECIKTVAPDGTLRQMNSTGLEMVEADSESEVVGECVYDLIAPADRERFREFNERVCRGESGTLKFDIVGLDGTRRHMESHAAPLHHPDGTTSHVAVTRDVTERKEREARLESKTDRLESFASMLAHELRNPTMIGQIYSQQLPSDADSEAVDYVTEAFDRIEDMIDVMLVLTQGREAVGERTSVELPEIAEQAWVDVDAPDADIGVEIDDSIEADETYVRHLFRNLFDNAVEHAGSDVTVAVGGLTDGPASDANDGSAGETLAGFYVADDGPGIPPEEREAVFDEGYTTTAESGGTGLGLAFVQELVEVYEWECRVTESASGGARFEFRVD